MDTDIRNELEEKSVVGTTKSREVFLEVWKNVEPLFKNCLAETADKGNWSANFFESWFERNGVPVEHYSFVVEWALARNLEVTEIKNDKGLNISWRK